MLRVPPWLLLSLLLPWLPPKSGVAQTAGQSFEVSQEQAVVGRLLIESTVGAPMRVTLADVATLRLVGALQFVPPDVAARYLRAYAQAVPDGLVGLFTIGGRELPWLATIRLVRGGFVDVSQVRRWSEDDLLASIRDEVARDNEERASRGLPARVISGWRIPPRYDGEIPSLIWSVRSFVYGVSAQNESDARVFVALFGRAGYFLIEIIANGEVIRANPGDIGLLTNSFRFMEGHRFADFVPGVDPVAPQGLEGVLDVAALRRVGFLEGRVSTELLVILAVGGVLVLGAGAMALILFETNRRRNRRG